MSSVLGHGAPQIVFKAATNSKFSFYCIVSVQFHYFEKCKTKNKPVYLYILVSIDAIACVSIQNGHCLYSILLHIIVMPIKVSQKVTSGKSLNK